ncbi:hypothetical protein [Streptomyces sp. CRN 30]|uniref:hypothetical protein n=1 Tax=Streptomyces sp. CRN 30 TaxID=3075613 RepID=UPI002A7FDEE6|nr:hypothetical protein [Streptomyces sp. CRN 30]
MCHRRTLRLFTLSAAVAVSAIGGATTASAGGALPDTPPAAGAGCRGSDEGARAGGATTHGTGTLHGNATEGPVGGSLNQCGGTSSLVAPPAVGALFLGPALQNLAQKMRGGM